MTNVRKLAQIIADANIEAAQFLDAVELAEEEEIDLTEDQMSEALRLALRAKAVLPDD